MHLHSMEFLGPVLLLVVSLGVIVRIVMRRWGQLVLLDVDSIPSVREAKKRNEMLRKKIDERAVRSREKVNGLLFAPLVHRFKEQQARFRAYVGRIEKELFHGMVPEAEVSEIEEMPDASVAIEEPIEEEEAKDTVSLDTLLSQAGRAAEREDWDEAERLYLAAIAVDKKCVDAYKGLGQVYTLQEQLEEAKELYHFLERLAPDDDTVLTRLGDIAEAEGDIGAAIGYYQEAVLLNPQLATRFAHLAELLRREGAYETALTAMLEALELEPGNLTYLDMSADFAILSANRNLAEDLVEQLRMKDPESARLDILRDRISQIEE